MENLFSKIFKNYTSKNNKEKEHELCDWCQSPLVMREGQYGKFLGCSEFPTCRFTCSIPETTLDKEFGERSILFNEYLTIVSGKQVCYACKNRTTVSGIALLHDEISFFDCTKDSILDYGYDIFIIPWSENISKLPKQIQYYVVRKYPIQKKYSKVLNDTYFANVCEFCGRLQGDNYVYHDTSHDSPFDIFSKEQLLLEQIRLDQSFVMSCSFDSDISPITNFMKRSKKIRTNYI